MVRAYEVRYQSWCTGTTGWFQGPLKKKMEFKFLFNDRSESGVFYTKMWGIMIKTCSLMYMCILPAIKYRFSPFFWKFSILENKWIFFKQILKFHKYFGTIIYISRSNSLIPFFPNHPLYHL